MKKSIAIFLSVILLLAITFPAAAVSTIPVKGIKLNNTVLALNVGQFAKLHIIFTPSNTTQKNMTYATSNKNIAIVDSQGKITGISKGTAIISVYSFDKKLSAKCSVTVKQVIDTSKAVALKMILLGPKPVDCDEVYEKVNERAKFLINASVTPIFFDWGDWVNKYNLAFASGEDFDLIYTSNWASYKEQSTKNGFLELSDDLLKKYAPRCWADITKDQWMQTMINGKVYMIPYTKKEFPKTVAMIRGDLRKKYNLPEVKTQNDLLNYMDAIAKNEKTVLAYNAGGADGTLTLYNLLFIDPNAYFPVLAGSQTLPLTISMKDKTKLDFVNLLEDPEYISYLKKLQTFKNKGYWSQNALSNKTINDTAFDNGTSATFLRGTLNVSQAYMKNSIAHPDWNLEIVDVNPGIFVSANPVTNNGVAIHATSKNPERALMMLDLLRNDQDINDLTTLGIPGKHWQAVGTDKYKALPDGKNFAPDSACPWGWRTDLFRMDASAPQVIVDINKELDKKATVHPIQLFNFDDSKVKSEAAAVSAVISQYAPILNEGFSEDIAKMIGEYKAKLEKAGYDKLVTEYKAQANAFMKAYGK